MNPKVTLWFVYVLQSQEKRPGGKPGFFYVGCTTDPVRRLKEHNGLASGGGKYTSRHRPWLPAALYGTYDNRSDAMKAEWALKHGKRGISRTKWSSLDSPWCRGLGPLDPWVTDGVTPSFPSIGDPLVDSVGGI